MSIEPEGAYLARKACGCITLIVAEHHREAGRMVGRAIKDGDRVERVTVEQVRASGSLRCPAHKPSKQVELPFEARP
jgi:hypothetical protein